MLPQNEAQKLLESVNDYVQKTPFLTGPSSVEIMDGTDEGIFSWFTVNYLLGKCGRAPDRILREHLAYSLIAFSRFAIHWIANQ